MKVRVCTYSGFIGRRDRRTVRHLIIIGKMGKTIAIQDDGKAYFPIRMPLRSSSSVVDITGPELLRKFPEIIPLLTPKDIIQLKRADHVL